MNFRSVLRDTERIIDRFRSLGLDVEKVVSMNSELGVKLESMWALHDANQVAADSDYTVLQDGIDVLYAELEIYRQEVIDAESLR